MKLKVLMVDDHPSIIEGYKIILSYNDLGYDLDITAAHNCKEVYNIVTKTKKKEAFDIVFLDYSLPPFPEKNLKNGEDLALLIRKSHPTSKIIILTSHTESLILYPILKNVFPEGLLIKSDFSGDELIKAFDTIMRGNIYQSVSVDHSVKELLSKKIFLDNFNRQIISLLAQGIKTKNLPEYLSLSMSAIEKRKVQIRDYFCIVKGSDEDIIREAKKLGLI